MNIAQHITGELSLKQFQVENTLKLREEGGTIPFIARYRKEQTGELNEIVITEIFEKFDYYTELEDRKQTILKSIEEQGKLTDELKNKIINCLNKTQLEDLYLPYKPKKRTRATIAKEKGLEPLALKISEINSEDLPFESLESLAKEFINEELGVKDVKEALAGASDIIAETISENATYREIVRKMLYNTGIFTAKIKSDFPEGTTKFENYRDFQTNVANITPHTMLALRRGETEKILTLDLKFEEEDVYSYLRGKILVNDAKEIVEFLSKTIKDSFDRLMKTSLIAEIRLMKKQDADIESVKVFSDNLRQVLLASPAGMKVTIGVDPGFRTGCKVVVLDKTGQFLEYKSIFPFMSANQVADAKKILLDFIKRYGAELIAIGNGTASRETDDFVSKVIAELDKKPVKIIVNESGASIYSASKVAQEEFPELDLTVRGAISIARRLQDPLAELVKIDAKSIGVGQYQHDVEQKLLKKKLDDTVESCVNFVGVDLNTASKELLTYVSGINDRIAGNIIEFRNKKGEFKSRAELLKVPSFGAKAFENAAGFLRIRNGKNLLDNTAVHPESYGVVSRILEEEGISLETLNNNLDKLKNINLKKYITDTIGEPTLKDIIGELEKPGRDPRAEFSYASFDDKIKEMSDLTVGMILEGVVTNITNFGAFVDIGVHQDGLVHISEISHTFITEPTKLLKVGQIVKVKVLEVNIPLKRIGLSIKQLTEKPPQSKGNYNNNSNNRNNSNAENNKTFNLGDLKSRFGK
jgi:uncharacterized protein